MAMVVRPGSVVFRQICRRGMHTSAHQHTSSYKKVVALVQVIRASWTKEGVLWGSLPNRLAKQLESDESENKRRQEKLFELHRSMVGLKPSDIETFASKFDRGIFDFDVCQALINNNDKVLALEFSRKYIEVALTLPHEHKIKVIERYVRAGGDLNIDFDGSSLLHFLVSNFPKASQRCDKDEISFIRTLLRLGAKINYSEYDDGSPVHDLLYWSNSFKSQEQAANCPRLKLAVAFLKTGVNVNKLNDRWRTPLDLLCDNKKGYVDTIPLRLRCAVRGFGDTRLLLRLPFLPFTVVCMGISAVKAAVNRAFFRTLSIPYKIKVKYL